MYKLVDGVKVKLTQTEIDARRAEEKEYQDKIESLEYRQEHAREKRKNKYLPSGDQLDAILKQLNYDRINGKEMVQEMDNVINHWLNVKATTQIPQE